MPRETHPSNGDFERFNQSDEADFRSLLDSEPVNLSVALQATLEKLQEAVDSDAALNGVGDIHARTRKFVMRSHGNDAYKFIHDRVILVPKRLEQSFVAKRELRFASIDDNLESVDSNYVFISDFNEEGELIGDFILSNNVFGWYTDDVDPIVTADRVTGIVGLQHEADFNPEYFVAELEMFELRRQLNGESTEAA